MEPISLTIEMMVVLGLLAFTIFLFVSEIIRVDLAGLLVMVTLGGLSYLPGLGDLATGLLRRNSRATVGALCSPSCRLGACSLRARFPGSALFDSQTPRW